MIDGYLPVSDRQRLSHSQGWQTVAIVVLLAGVASIPLAVTYEGLAMLQARKVDWAIPGAACPSPAQPIRFHRQPLEFDYQGVHFTRRYGAVSCVVVPEGGLFSNRGYPACQFSSPAQLTVTARGGTVLFEPGFGHPATVTVRAGRSSCVVGGSFR